MNSRVVHPGLWQLQRFQTQARLVSFWRRIRRPRRIITSSLAVLFAIIWLSQAVAGILFREAGDPEKLMMWIPLGLTTYALWHVIKVTTRAPIEPFEWTETERELLLAAPFDRRDLIRYRLLNIVSAALVKALCFGLVMIPDLPLWPLGFVGMLLALTFLDLLRMLVEVVVWGVSSATRLKLRVAVLTLTIGVALSGLISALATSEAAADRSVALGLILRFLNATIALQTTLPGRIVTAPFRVFGNVILADQWTMGLLGQLVLALSILSLAAWLLIRCDAFFQQHLATRERQRFPRIATRRSKYAPAERHLSTRRLWVPPAWGGIATLAWRQCLGVAHYPSAVVVSMLLPGFLSLLVVFTDASGISMLIQIVGALVFYSFLLMPAALRFDFRRDVSRMTVLKSLPFTPLAITIGQLFAPVITCTLFQLTVLCIAWMFRPFPLPWLVISTLLLIPVNGLIFAIENLIFLLYPYRPNEEGVGVFVRSILTFTAKGVLFLMAIVLTMAWVGASHWLTDATSWGTTDFRLAVYFTGGMWGMTAGMTIMLVATIARVFDRFDPSQDTPALA